MSTKIEINSKEPQSVILACNSWLDDLIVSIFKFPDFCFKTKEIRYITGLNIDDASRKVLVQSLVGCLNQIMCCTDSCRDRITLVFTHVPTPPITIVWVPTVIDPWQYRPWIKSSNWRHSSFLNSATRFLVYRPPMIYAASWLCAVEYSDIWLKLIFMVGSVERDGSSWSSARAI